MARSGSPRTKIFFTFYSEKMVLTRSRAHQTPLENNAENNNKPSGDAKSKDESKRANKVLGVLFISLVVDLLAFTMILPLLPALLDHYGKQEKVMFKF